MKKLFFSTMFLLSIFSTVKANSTAVIEISSDLQINSISQDIIINDSDELECFEFAIILYHGTIKRAGKTIDDALELAEWGYNQCMEGWPMDD